MRPQINTLKRHSQYRQKHEPTVKTENKKILCKFNHQNLHQNWPVYCILKTNSHNRHNGFNQWFYLEQNTGKFFFICFILIYRKMNLCSCQKSIVIFSLLLNLISECFNANDVIFVVIFVFDGIFSRNQIDFVGHAIKWSQHCSAQHANAPFILRQDAQTPKKCQPNKCKFGAVLNAPLLKARTRKWLKSELINPNCACSLIWIGISVPWNYNMKRSVQLSDQSSHWVDFWHLIRMLK